MDLNMREPGTPPPADRDITLRMQQFDDIGETYQRTATSWCGDSPPPEEDPVDETRWKDRFDRFHIPEFNEGFRDWQMGAGDLVATKSYTRPRDGSGTDESTRLELWHTPEE